jgi:hypothetical protein
MPLQPIDRTHTTYAQIRLPCISSALPATRAAAKGGVRDQVDLSASALTAAQDSTRPGASMSGQGELTDEERQKVDELKKRDAEVKAHEQAHMSSGGGFVQGGAAYQYEIGPDGRQYAVGGEVKIDVSQERTPEATIRKMQQVRRAALAPAQPSGTDRAVAARAAQVEAQARMQLSEQKREYSDPSHQAAAGEPNLDTIPISHQDASGARGSRIDLVI